MKRILCALAMVGCLLSLAPRAETATEVSLDIFYDNLSPYGSWIEVGDYGYCFQPNVAVNNPSWRPYADGYWAYTDVGWTWVSYEDFGWATYHYGRWANLDAFGWVWVPGYEWGPAWVSWRTGGDYIGWAPLPPTREYVYEGRPITGHVDVEFDIGPLFYNFVDIRYIGEPVLRERLIVPQQNVTIINRTVNVTNITYNNSTVYNYGPDLNRVNQFSTRPVQRLSIQRETNVATTGQARRGNLNRVNGNQFVVAAPKIKKSSEKVAPKQVKAKVQQPKIERGWQGVSNREQIQTAMKKEDPKNVPPPDVPPQRGANAEAGRGGTGRDTAQPNENKQGAENAAPNQGQGQNERSARQAEGNNRRENAGQPPNANATEDQSADRQAQRDRRAGKRRPNETPNQPATDQDQNQPNAGNSQQNQQTYNRPNRPPRAQRNQDQPQASPSAEDRDQGNQSAERPEQADRRQEQADRRQEQADGRPEQAGRRERGQDESADQPDRNRPSANAQQQQRPRSQRPATSQPRNDRDDRNQPGGDVDRPSQAQRGQKAQRPPQRERSPEARTRQQQAQPQGQDDQKGERKGKKKKPEEEQPAP